ncbi:hypothetical protein K437DRAFT_256384 [Tilletiaria anomala UBC 951]|uniref:Vps72/YL1 C-terminal domain-containing protein n=1 Tax=Tilletiaria anomala (strain ATCC 24038 / CBS 436.72 / UBC 951) TaxID=1037660 RepID=A0A066W0A5_TILAU|nr:uncharacterized protein K437DRAFT_256384 [Tilletiaria anomala UBC 951]KDN45968.1 hypothetical protein K437DRAFT_256384 [Tilletiaria anomala UBC 951]
MSTAGPSKAGSTSSTPAPPSAAETLSHTLHAKPFKNPSFSKPLNRRNKTLKQIVTAERDLALGIVNRKKGKKGQNGEEPLVIIRGKTKLAGAAAKAALKREARAKKEAAAKAAAEAAEAAAADGEEGEEDEAEANGEESSTATPAPADQSSAGATTEGDATMDDISISMVVADTPASTAQPAASSQPKKDVPKYFTVEAPPSLRARKKYCDVTGLIAPYTDPRTRLRYHSAEIFEIIRNFGPGMDQAYLALRGDSTSIK